MRRLPLAVVLAACAPRAPEPRAPTPLPGPAVTTASSVAPADAWSDVTRSPWPLAEEASDREAALARACGQPDGALDRVARGIAAERARGLGVPPADEVASRLRAAGEPHVRPRVLTASGRAPVDEATLRARLGALRTDASRCAVAIADTPHGGEVLVAIAVDALAELAPLPVRARAGEWLAFEARVLPPARTAKLVVTGPRGMPRTFPTSLDPSSHAARARFTLDRPGAFLVQLVADLDEGPRPVLEARVFADVAPSSWSDAPAPGEDASDGNDAESLATRIAALRAADGAAPLLRDPALDALAAEHAAAMLQTKMAAHDVGEGDLRARFEAAGDVAKTLGENVAHAADVARAHRALYASPSHRMNLLRADYTHFGVAVVEDEDGSVFVCEVFARR